MEASWSTCVELLVWVGKLESILKLAELVEPLLEENGLGLTSQDWRRYMRSFVESCELVLGGAQPFYQRYRNKNLQVDVVQTRKKREQGKSDLMEARRGFKRRFELLSHVWPIYERALDSLKVDPTLQKGFDEFRAQYEAIGLIEISRLCWTFINAHTEDSEAQAYGHPVEARAYSHPVEARAYGHPVEARAYGRPALAVDPSSFGVPFHLRRVRVLGGSLQSRFQ